MNEKEIIKNLQLGNVVKMERIDELLKQNDALEYKIFNYQIWVGILTIVIVIMIYAVAR